MRNGQQSFTGLTGVGMTAMSMTGKGKPQRVWGLVVSANYFDVLGVRPIMGRTFLLEEDTKLGGAPVVVISYRLWQTHFGGRTDIIGQSMALNEQPYTIIGVTPSGFPGTFNGLSFDLWFLS